MVQKASETSAVAPKKRGRPPKFDRDEVVQAAITAFFRSGYEATTLADIEAATGIDRSTLYNSFGGKAGLYESATRTYLELAEQTLFHPLLVGTDDGYADVLTFLSNLRTGLTSADAIPGCLIVNDMAAGADPDAAARYRATMEEGLQRALTRAGNLDDERRLARAKLLASSVLGVNLVSKVTADPVEIATAVDAMEAEVRRWQADH